MVAVNTLARPAAVLELTGGQYDPEHDLIDLNPAGRAQTRKFRPVVPATATIQPLLVAAGTGPVVLYNGRSIGSIRTAFQRLRRAAHLDETVNPYSFRHTMARAMRRAKVPADQISIMLGHVPAQSSRTSMVYAPYEPDYARTAAAAIDDFLEQVRQLSRRKLEPPRPIPKAPPKRSRQSRS